MFSILRILVEYVRVLRYFERKKKREKQENLEDKNRNRNIYEPLC